MAFNYLGVEKTVNQDRAREVSQVNKANGISASLTDIIWNHMHMSKDTKIKVYKTCIRHTMKFAVEQELIKVV